jgi:hypothetical protein
MSIATVKRHLLLACNVYRDVSAGIAGTLRQIGMRYPSPTIDPSLRVSVRVASVNADTAVIVADVNATFVAFVVIIRYRKFAPRADSGGNVRVCFFAVDGVSAA